MASPGMVPVDLAGRGGRPGEGITALGPDLFAPLRARGSAPALFCDDIVVSYAELADRVDEAAARLGTLRRLVLLEAVPAPTMIAAYLAALDSGHPVLLASGPELLDALRRRFDPDLTIADGGWTERRSTSRHALHPELALMLSTSGSTGSPKLARLSYQNLASNAAAIAGYLALTADDRAITSLPLGYCYGLSVLHSHLAVGASVALTDRSVLDGEFWRLFGEVGATSLAGVPHTFELLERSGIGWAAQPTLRYVTQAGGRLPPEDVRRLHRLGRVHGWDFVVMYGQTEATARMAYLPPDQAGDHPDCIGVPIPGGRLRVDRPDSDGVGELVYSGPNVMLGYADGPAALSDGPALAELRTGDLGREVAGLFAVVGRISRRAKLLGNRIDLDRVAAGLTSVATEPVCVSDDRHLVVAVRAGDPALVRRRVVALTGLPPGLVRVRQVAEPPRLPNGKLDLGALLAPEPGAWTGRLAALRAAYAQVLGYDRVADSASFASLGGDSLSFVEMSVRLEEVLGWLPVRWPERSIAELATARRPRPVQPVRRARPRLAEMDTSVPLRALAITLIVVAHLQMWGVSGGGHLLLALAGFTFARFALSGVRQTDSVAGLARAVGRLAGPALLFVWGVVLLSGDEYAWWNLALANWVFGPPVWTARWNFWFLEVLVVLSLAALALFAVPAVRRLDTRRPLLLPAAIVAIGLVGRYGLLDWADVPMRYGRPYTVFWIFALGWLIHRASGRWPRVAVSLLVVIAFTGYFPGDPVRALVVQTGLLVLIWLPSVPLPRPLVTPLSRVAAASLWIYLTHWVVWPQLLGWLPRGAIVICCLLVGIGVHALVETSLRTGLPAVRDWSRRWCSGLSSPDRRWLRSTWSPRPPIAPNFATSTVRNSGQFCLPRRENVRQSAPPPRMLADRES